MKFAAASTIIAIAATITGAQAQFVNPCNAPYDVCGWTLTNEEFDYNEAVLQAAARAAGQDASDNRIVYDSIYNCREGGVIVWNQACPNGCDPPITGPNANCRA
ncbi:hypothetical protein MMYC01_200201 [Madurella mycetomatis]|uniref:Uncharacterized protein n=1 Tax=Madurella mycetomatis TaxID=100816 RepID=A0A175WH84_9PEZI|nr:hypothetical protein MMYC01_200201 [Madurella mycetomatis]